MLRLNAQLMSAKLFTSWRSMATHYDSLIGYLQISRGIHINSVRKFSALLNNKCCLHSFYYIFFDRLPWSESELIYQERKFPGTFAPGKESSRKLSFLGAKDPTENFHSEERKYRGAESPDTTFWYLFFGRNTGWAGIIMSVTSLAIRLVLEATVAYYLVWVRHSQGPP